MESGRISFLFHLESLAHSPAGARLAGLEVTPFGSCAAASSGRAGNGSAPVVLIVGKWSRGSNFFLPGPQLAHSLRADDAAKLLQPVSDRLHGFPQTRRRED